MRFAVCFIFVIAAVTLTAADWPADNGSSLGPDQFIQVSGRKLIDPDGNEFLIKGIAFGNRVWQNVSREPSGHHGPGDYETIKSLGFNSVRFYLNYQLFEDDARPFEYKEEGFAWIDKNIAAARKAGIRLILNMHIPQGGFQSLGKGDALWQKAGLQERLAALWQAIAERYKDEQQIIGYGLVNEPIPTGTLAKWTDLAQKLITSIRQADEHHIVFVEKAIYVEDNYTIDENLNFPMVQDPAGQMVYEFHMYEPMGFTHMNAVWIPALAGHYSEYPDNERLIISGTSKWAGFFPYDSIPSQSRGWNYFESDIFIVQNDSYSIAYPCFQAAKLGADGSAYFDDIVIEEYDENGTYLGDVVSISNGFNKGWSLWSQDGSGQGRVSTESRNDNESLLISGTLSDSNFTGHGYPVKVVQGHGYKVKGVAKVENAGPAAEVRLRIDFNTLSSEAKIMNWNRDYLISYISDYVNFSEKHTIPVYLGEFGAISFAFEHDRGGERWVRDVIEILQDNSISYNYHTYHEEGFGLFLHPSYRKPVAAAMNRILADVFIDLQFSDE